MTDPVRHLAQTGHLDRFYIDGAWVKPQGRERAEVVDPATETVIAEIPLGSMSDTDHAVRAARKAFCGWSRTTPSERAALLSRIHALVLELSLIHI